MPRGHILEAVASGVRWFGAACGASLCCLGCRLLQQAQGSGPKM